MYIKKKFLIKLYFNKTDEIYIILAIYMVIYVEGEVKMIRLNSSNNHTKMRIENQI